MLIRLAPLPRRRNVADHHTLWIHHVREGVSNKWAYDTASLAFRALLIIGGWLLARSERGAA
jgi:uncharacterized membrane protein